MKKKIKNTQPLKLDMTFEEAMKKALSTPLKKATKKKDKKTKK
jgi:hypothetical protein